MEQQASQAASQSDSESASKPSSKPVATASADAAAAVVRVVATCKKQVFFLKGIFFECCLLFELHMVVY